MMLSAQQMQSLLISLSTSPIRAALKAPNACKRLPCRRVNGRYLVPCESIIRDFVIRVDPVALNQPLTD